MGSRELNYHLGAWEWSRNQKENDHYAHVAWQHRVQKDEIRSVLSHTFEGQEDALRYVDALWSMTESPNFRLQQLLPERRITWGKGKESACTLQLVDNTSAEVAPMGTPGNAHSDKTFAIASGIRFPFEVLATFIGESSPYFAATVSPGEVRELISQWVGVGKKILAEDDASLLALQAWELRWLSMTGMADIAIKRYKHLLKEVRIAWGKTDPRYWLMRMDEVIAYRQARTLRQTLVFARRLGKDSSELNGENLAIKLVCLLFVAYHESLVGDGHTGEAIYEEAELIAQRQGIKLYDARGKGDFTAGEALRLCPL